MPSPRPVGTEREIRLKYTQHTVLEALGLTPGVRDHITLTINQYGELVVTIVKSDSVTQPIDREEVR